jgi:hypothetical protein
MFEFTDDERAGLRESRALNTDSQGRQILVGLTLEETAEVMEHRRAFRRGEQRHENKKRISALVEKHEAARLEVLGTEMALKRSNPPIH